MTHTAWTLAMPAGAILLSLVLGTALWSGERSRLPAFFRDAASMALVGLFVMGLSQFVAAVEAMGGAPLLGFGVALALSGAAGTILYRQAMQERSRGPAHAPRPLTRPVVNRLPAQR